MAPLASDSAALLLEEYKHLTDSLLRNEERRERLGEWFIIFGAAVVVVLIAARPDYAFYGGAMGIVLLLGLIARARIIHRNLAADEYEEKIRGIERFFVDQDPDVGKYLPYPLRADPHWRAKKLRFVGAGGVLQVVEFANSLAAGLFVALLPVLVFGSETISIVAVALGIIAAFAFQFLERFLRAPRNSESPVTGVTSIG